jgi:hypothetical protein
MRVNSKVKERERKAKSLAKRLRKLERRRANREQQPGATK